MPSGFEPVALPLVDLLERAPSLPDTLALYARLDRPLAANEVVVIADPDDLDDWEDEPPLARAHGCAYLLSLPDLKAVVHDLERLHAHPTLAERVTALAYYLENDRFQRL
ncbi:DUF7716 domain-containing protein [Deinococcus pimensis]|uniref:DUF7716 domain-containing protein n=1 Tax=Deinococcus pimensis TaxID=309888 RepID=UPI0004804246|nr:hypothetical protein [Deinococcus pimensis]